METTKFNYGNGSSVNEYARKDIISYAYKITDNANNRVIPFLFAAGIKPTIENVLATSVKLDDLREYFKQDYKQKHPNDTSSEILGDVIEDRLNAKFYEIYKVSCRERRADEAFRDAYLDPEHAQFYYLTTNLKELRIDVDKVDRACTEELTAEEKPIFDKICKVCDALNDLFDVSPEAKPTEYSQKADFEWSKVFECLNVKDGKPAFRPSLPLRTDLLKIKF
ncbi:MAG: hypothetical protein IJ552_07540 [Prevotella sp.]|nr:hypothetical protein [Prevotella sp.]